ncbi:DUF4286 family protein [Bdellovibrio svalbardensis]
MVTYTVHMTVQHEAYAEYVEWLKTEHIPDFLKVPGFLSADLCLRKGGAMVASSKEVKIIYHVKDEDHLKAYISDYAMKLREKGLEKFPGKFSATREVWLETLKFGNDY